MKSSDFDASSLLGVAVMGAIALTALIIRDDNATAIATGVTGAIGGWMAHKQSTKTVADGDGSTAASVDGAGQ